MTATVVLGLAWGDEGKGRVCDALAADARYVSRYSGGNNAGHTVRVGEEEFVLHLLPSGVLREGVTCTIGNGVVVNPEVLREEIEALEKRGFGEVRQQLKVDGRAHLIMPYHIALDTHREESLGKARLGTTNRGIGPCYEDKAGRVGIRVQDVFDEDVLRHKLEKALVEKNAVFQNIYGEEPHSLEDLLGWLVSFRDLLAPMVEDTGVLLREALGEGEPVLFEGAQATLLDVDHGTYPYVTSSNPSVGGVCVGAGIPPQGISDVIGVTKAYTTRVGDGPFPTELFDEAGEILAAAGHEFGSTTGRARRCGWLDLVATKQMAALNGVTQVAVTKLDVLSAVEEIKVCVGYEIDGATLDQFPMGLDDLGRVTPVYKSLPGWGDDISECRMRGDLPEEAQDFVGFIETELGAPLCMISVGPERDQAIVEKVGV
ncbi:MAG: adenylosuccinate synthase [Rubrobacter sp.]|nr:adenylosuccinate synthase [Rubrobacter sp.]